MSKYGNESFQTHAAVDTTRGMRDALAQFGQQRASAEARDLQRTRDTNAQLNSVRSRERQSARDGILDKRYVKEQKHKAEQEALVEGHRIEAERRVQAKWNYKLKQDAAIKMQNEAWANSLLNVPETGTGQVPTAAVAGNDKERQAIILREKNRDAFETGLDKQAIAANDKYQELYGKYTGVNDKHGQFLMAPAVGDTPDFNTMAHNRAMKESGMEGFQAQYDKLGAARETIPELVAPQAAGFKTVDNQPMDVGMKRKFLLNRIQNDTTMDGPTKVKAMASVNALYPAPKAASASTQLQFQKHNEKLVQDANTVAGLRSMYPSMPAEVKTPAAAQAWATKVNKKKTSTGKGFSMQAELYKVIEAGKDSEDVTKLASLLKANGGRFKKMSKADKKAFVAKFKAQYAEESGWDISDFLGGTPVNDAWQIATK